MELNDRVLCFHRDGVILNCLYPYTARYFARRSWAFFRLSGVLAFLLLFPHILSHWRLLYLIFIGSLFILGECLMLFMHIHNLLQPLGLRIRNPLYTNLIIMLFMLKLCCWYACLLSEDWLNMLQRFRYTIVYPCLLLFWRDIFLILKSGLTRQILRRQFFVFWDIRWMDKEKGVGTFFRSCSYYLRQSS